MGLALVTFACAAPVATAKRSCQGFEPSTVALNYPAERFLVGLGSVGGIWDPAKGAESGRAAALADMASQLHAEVASAVSLHAWESSHGGDTRIDETIDVKTKMVLQGARVAATCFEPSQTTFHVVAIAERAELAKRLVADQHAANERGAESLRLAQEHLDSGRTLEALHPARAAVSAADEAAKDASVFRAITGTNAPATFASAQQVSTVLAQAMSQLSVRLAVVDLTGIIASAIQDRLTGANISTNRSGDAVIAVAGRVEDLGNEGSSGGIVYVRFRVTIDVKRLDTGATIGSIAREQKGGGRSRESARTDAANTLAASVAPEVARIVEKVLEMNEP